MKITFLGAGSWGTALATVASHNGYDCVMYDKDKAYEEINYDRTNPYFFNDFLLPDNIHFDGNLASALKGADVVFFSVPSRTYRDLAKEVTSLLDKKVYVVSTAKGFDISSSTFKTLSTVLREEIPEDKRYPIVSLLGPSFAKEVIARKMTCVTASSLSLETASYIQNIFSNSYFRIYTNDDEIGCECCASLKNVIAIAAGIAYGLDQGEDVKAALVTRGLKEVMKFGLAHGAKKDTYLGLAGVGDMMLTCNTLTSRNYSLGYEIGKNNDAREVLKNNKKTCEGVYTAKYIYELSKNLKIEMPIVQAVYEVLFNNCRPYDKMIELMARSLKKE